MSSHKEFYRKNSKERILFTRRFLKVYQHIGTEINKFLEDSSTLLFLSAGHSSLVDILKFKKIYVSEIIDEFHSLYKKKN